MSDAPPPPEPGRTPAASAPQPKPDDPAIRASVDRYWASNLRLMSVLLLIWAIAGLGCGVLWADWLNTYEIGGVPLGFWFAQQGSIITFVLLILVYAILMNRLDRRHNDELAQLRARPRLDTPDDSEAR